MYRTGTPPELERKPSYNTLEIGGRSAKFLTRSGSLGSRHRLLPSSQFSPSSNPFSEQQVTPPRNLLARSGSSSLRVGTLLNLLHIAVTLALAVACTVLYRDRLLRSEFVDACEKDHVTTRTELELVQSELTRYKILQNTMSAAQVVPAKCPECPTSPRTPHFPLAGGRRRPALSTAPLDTAAAAGVASMKRLIEERDELEKKLRIAHLKAPPSFLKTIEKYRAAEQRLIRAVQTMSAELLRLKFGPGPHYAELTLGFADAATAPQRVMLELSAREMPYTTLYFMTQLEEGMWRGCHFNYNPGHIVQADPNTLPRRAGRFGSMVEACDRARFNAVPYADAEGHAVFQEYAESKPHVPYTLGLPGRSGGPSFYINTLDNTEIHGPGGQPNDDGQMPDPASVVWGPSSGAEARPADPCFARVVSGYDVVQKLQQQHVVSGESARGQLGDFVTILDAVVVQKTHPATNKRFIDSVLSDYKAQQQL